MDGNRHYLLVISKPSSGTECETSVQPHGLSCTQENPFFTNSGSVLGTALELAVQRTMLAELIDPMGNTVHPKLNMVFKDCGVCLVRGFFSSAETQNGTGGYSSQQL